MYGSWVEVGVVVLVVMTGGLFAFAAFLLWRNGYRKGWRAARAKPPTCLSCGYNLSGLTHGRCPECGHEHRLDELWLTPLPYQWGGMGSAPAPKPTTQGQAVK